MGGGGCWHTLRSTWRSAAPSAIDSRSSTRTTTSITTVATRTVITGVVLTARAKCVLSVTVSWPSAAATTGSSTSTHPTHPTSSTRNSARSFSSNWRVSPTPPSVTFMTISTSQLSIEVPFYDLMVLTDFQWTISNDCWYCIGVPDKLIPSFWSVRSTMYRLKPNRVDDDPINNNFSSSNSSIMEIRSSMQQQNSLECN